MLEWEGIMQTSPIKGQTLCTASILRQFTFPLCSASHLKDKNFNMTTTYRCKGRENSWNLIRTHTHRISTQTAPSFLKYFKEEVVYHGWSVTGERQSAARLRVALVVHEAMDVTGQTGSGANSVVPQNMDHIIQSVQTVLHLRLQTPGKLFCFCFFIVLLQTGQDS